MKKRFKEPIQNRAFILALIFVTALIIISFTYLHAASTSLKYQKLIENQRAHQELGNVLITKLISIENEFGQLAYIKDPRDITRSEETIENLLTDTQTIIQILHLGGSFIDTVPANTGEVDELEIRIEYTQTNTNNTVYPVEALELMPRILDVEYISHKLFNTVEQGFTATTPEEKLASVKEIEILLKQADTFFIRSQESANRIYYDSHIEMDRLATEREKTLRRIGALSAFIILTVVTVGGSLAYRVLKQISELLKERSEGELLLREAESRYRTVADFTYDWEYWRNPDGTLEYVSPASKRITGYSAVEILARPALLDEIVYEEDAHIWKKHGNETNKQHTLQDITFRIRRKDGNLIWVEHACQPVTTPTGEFVGFRASNRDISNRVEVQNALLESEKLYRSLFENSQIGIVLASKTGNVLSINPTALKMLGSPSKEASLTINLLTFPPLVESGFVQDFYKSLKTGKTIQNRTLYTSKWGVRLHSRYTLTAIKDTQENLLGVQILLEDTTEQVHDKADLQRQIRNFTAINTINTAILTRTDLEGMVAKVLQEIVTHLSVDAADVLIYDEFGLTLSCSGQYGFYTRPNTEQTVLRVGDGFAGKAALQRKTLRIKDLQDGHLNLDVPERWHDENFIAYFGVPLLVKGELKGILELFQRVYVERDKAWLDLMDTLAQQTAIALDSYFLLDALQRSNLELELAYETTLEGWARALEMRDYETQGHTQRVAALTVDLARVLGIRGEELTHIRRGALLHDIGKIAVSDTILLKKGSCTEDEWKVIRQHPRFGYEMLQKITYLKPSLDIVLYHHERWDGAGYPEGLSGERIPLTARIFAIVDVWDALTSERPYHKALSRKKTLLHIQNESDKHFDPRIVEAFQSIIQE